MKLLIWYFCAVFSGPVVYSSEITTSTEQRILVESLSGAAQLGVGGLPSIISQRFSDSPEIQVTARYLKAKYEEAGITAQILDYNPMDAFPYYVQNTNETYRAYFRPMMGQFKIEFDGLCADTLSPSKQETVLNRIRRVGLEKDSFCVNKAENRVEVYISATVMHTANVTRRMLQRRTQTTWPNVLAVISTSDRAGEVRERPLCLIGAHMDSVARGGGNRGPIVSPAILAPGADDNASGTAAVLTLARALRDWVKTEKKELACDLAFAHFSGEEEGLLGSLAFARIQVKRPLLWMVNFDMIAYNNAPKPAMNVGYDKRWGGLGIATFFDRGVNGTLRTVIVERDAFIYSSDQISFWDIHVPAISISEQACTDPACSERFKYFNPNLHTEMDVVKNLDFKYAANIVNQSFTALTELLTYKQH